MEPDVRLQCAAASAWGSAALRGAVSLDAALDALRTLPVDLRFRSGDLGLDPQPLALAVGRWRSRGIDAWRYVPVAAGDSGGMPGPPTLVGQAMDVGAAMVSLSGPAVALLPDPPADQDGCEPPPDIRPAATFGEVAADGRGVAPPESLTDLDQALLVAISEATELLDDLEVAAWRDEVAELRRAWDLGPPMPPGTPDRAQRLAPRSGRVLMLVDVATTDHGASRTASEMASRSDQLRRLARAARAAHAAAWNAATFSGSPR